MNITAQGIATALGGVKRHSGGWLARCPTHQDKTASLSLTDRDGRILVKCFAGCDQHTVVDTLKHRHLWPGRDDQPPIISKRTEAPRTENQNKERAIKLWDEALPASGTLAEIYLNKRGIDLPDGDELRFHAKAAKWEGRLYSALVAAVRNISGIDIVAVHRILINRDGSPVLDDSRKKVKLLLGSPAGAAVKLSPATSELNVAEGIETALAVLQRTKAPTWSAINAAGLSKFPVIDTVSTLTIWADNDENGAGQRAAEACAERWIAAGKIARVLIPKSVGTDWADHFKRGHQ